MKFWNQVLFWRTGAWYGVQANLKLAENLLPQTPNCWAHTKSAHLACLCLMAAQLIVLLILLCREFSNVWIVAFSSLLSLSTLLLLPALFYYLWGGLTTDFSDGKMLEMFHGNDEMFAHHGLTLGGFCGGGPREESLCFCWFQPWAASPYVRTPLRLPEPALWLS